MLIFVAGMLNDKEHRLALTMDELSRKGFVSVNDLAGTFGVTSATIRNDLNTLELRHQVVRNHGGASLVAQSVVDLPVQEKARIHASEKKRIAREAARLISDSDSIIMTSGSTIEAMALAIHPKAPLNVVTPSIRVGVFLSGEKNVEVIMLGGRLVKKSLSVRDTYTLDGLKNVRCSKLFLSCDGFDCDAGVMTAFVEEARITNAMMDAASQVILLADSSKCGKVGFGKICDFSRIDILITDTALPESVRASISDAGVKVTAV